jgi:hypothetical protein
MTLSFFFPQMGGPSDATVKKMEKKLTAIEQRVFTVRRKQNAIVRA